MAKKGFALIGAGIWGQTHAKTYASSREVKFVGICDTNLDRAKEVAKKYGVKHITADYRELLESDSVDAVSIVTPDPYHTEIAVAAAEAGKHVLIEKPLATRTEDCLAILRAAKKAGIKLMVDFHNRWNPPFAKIKRALENGELGTPLAAYIRLSDTTEVPLKWLPWAAKSSVLWFLGSHCVDALRWVFEDEVESVFATSRSTYLRSLGCNTPDFFHSILQFRKGGSVIMENAWIISENAPIIFDFKFELLATKGTCYVNGSHHGMFERYTATERGYADVAVAPEVHGKPVGFGVESIRHFIECVVDDKEPLATGLDGLRATEVLLAVLESCESGAPAKVKLNTV